MSIEQPSRAQRPLEPGGAPAPAAVDEALCALYRSVGSHQFYPPTHRARVEAVEEGYRAWQAAEADARWTTLRIRARAGGLWCGEERLAPNNAILASLARLLSVHGVAGLCPKGPLSAAGFSHLVALLAAGPETLVPKGGLLALWQASEFGSSLDLQAFRVILPNEEQTGDPADAEPWGEAEAPDEDPAQRPGREKRLLELLAGLGECPDVGSFLASLERITALTRELAAAARHADVHHVVVALLRQAEAMGAAGRSGERKYLLDALRMLVGGAFLPWLVDRVATGESSPGEPEEALLRLSGRGAVVPLLNALAAERRRAGRRRLLGLLISMGDVVVPLAAKLLGDGRWYVVRNMVTILGSIGTPGCLKALGRVLGDPDVRVRKELARALARLQGPESEALLASLLRDSDVDVRLAAIAAAGCRRSAAVLELLWSCFGSAPEWDVKASVLQALGRLELPEAVERLEAVTRTSSLLHRRRWEALQVVATEALSRIGGEPGRAALERLREHRSEAVRETAARGLAASAEKRAPGNE